MGESGLPSSLAVHDLLGLRVIGSPFTVLLRKVFLMCASVLKSILAFIPSLTTVSWATALAASVSTASSTSSSTALGQLRGHALANRSVVAVLWPEADGQAVPSPGAGPLAATVGL